MRPESVARGTLILTASGVITRFIGFAVRIILVRIMGPEGIGLFSRVSAMYMLILSMASAGIPVAVAKLSAEELGRHSESSARRIAHVAALVNIATGILAMSAFILFARPLSSAILRDIRLYPIMLAIAPALAVVPVSSVLRGLLQAYQWMTPIAASQIAERIASGMANVVLASTLISHGVEYSAAGLALGMAIGEVVGLAVMAWAWHVYGRYPGDRRKSIKREAGTRPGENMGTLPIMTRLFGIGIPVAGARAAGSFSGAVMAVLIPERLMMAGLDIGKATAVYGSFQGIAMAVVFFPTVFTFSLSSNLVPAISRAGGAGDWTRIRERIKDSILITILTGLISTIFFVSAGDFICKRLFDTPDAIPVLIALSIGSTMIYLRITTGSIMQGLGLIGLATSNYIVGILLTLLLTYLLVPNPALHIYGAVMATLAGNMVNACLNWAAINRYLHRFPMMKGTSLNRFPVSKGTSFDLFFNRIMQEFGRIWRIFFHV